MIISIQLFTKRYCRACWFK